jgi:uncharacterized repeat protein (TIGR01451 family)
MKSEAPSSSAARGVRYLGLGAMLLGILVILLIGSPHSASAAAGATDLSLNKSDSADPVTVGSNFTYTIQVNNPPATGFDAANTVVTDTLPSQVDYVSATPSSGTCNKAGNVVTCNLGTVLTNTTATVTIVVKASKTGTASNTATVTADMETNATNNSDTETTVINKAVGNNKGKKKGKASCATPTKVGTLGDDVIVGTAGADVIVTYSGNDQVFSGGGKDLICAGAGADFVFSDTGGDTVIGGGGADTLKGGSGGDLLKGKNGRDRLRGQSGNDVLNGGKKRDSCKGGAGQDTLVKCP